MTEPFNKALPAPEPVMRVVHLYKRFGERWALEDINLEVFRGETLVVMGVSGCGKSTLLRHMIGSLTPDSGHVEVLGKNLNELDEDELDKVRLRLGILYQSGALFNSMTVGDNVALPLREHTHLDEQTIQIIVRIKLEQVGLGEAIDLMPAELSGGMRKRAGLARAISLDPEILLYDEPSSGLDPVTSAEIIHLMLDLSTKLGVTSMVVTHDMSSAFRIADRLAMLEEGRMIKIGPRSEFAAIRGGPPTAEPVAAAVRQFLRGESVGPLTARHFAGGYADDILKAINR